MLDSLFSSTLESKRNLLFFKGFPCDFKIFNSIGVKYVGEIGGRTILDEDTFALCLKAEVGDLSSLLLLVLFGCSPSGEFAMLLMGSILCVFACIFLGLKNLFGRVLS